jgi:hypothetical protein
MLRKLSCLKPSPAMAVALIALLAASTGWAIAATANDPVIRACANKKTGALRLASKCKRKERALLWNQRGPEGRRGRAGATGSRGATGATGATGPQGNPGPTTDVLPSGKTERGWFLADIPHAEKGNVLGTSITFNFALPSAPTVSYVDIGGAPTADCPGSLANPKAAPGKLCLYLGLRLNLKTTAPYVFGIDAISSNEEDSSVDPFGAQIYAQAVEAGRAEYHGTFAVTAP